MIQAYYLATEERKERFRAVFDRLEVIDTFFPVETVPSLTALISRNRAISQQDFIICDLTAAQWSDEHILSAVQMLRRFSVSKFVFLSPDSERTTSLFKHLSDMRVDGLIVDGEDAVEKLSAILQGDGGYLRRLTAVQQGLAATALEQAPPLRIPAGLVLDVAVGGAMPRVGTTAQVFALYHYLKTVGFRPALLDQGQDTYRLLRELCPEQAQKLSIVTERTADFDCYVFDCGVLDGGAVQSFCAADLSVLVGGGKPWELPALANVYHAVTAEHPRELVTLLSFATEQEEATVRQFIPTCATVPYHPDIWTAGSDTVYRDVILPALKRICSTG